jgi:uncharacterized membrane protein
MNFIYLIPIILSLSGFVLALYIYTTKKSKEKRPLVCPIGGMCDTVVNSKYSKFLGIPVELMGMGYYALVILFYSARMFGFEMGQETVFFVVSFSVLAFLFSVYLVFVQAFSIKHWCTWCLFSAAFTTFIAIFSVFITEINLIPLLVEYKTLIVIIHAMAAAVGVGATTVTDVLFFKFLKDFKISETEKSVMDTMSHIIWVALGILIITGIGLYLPRTLELAESSKFLVKTVAVGIITINGFVLNFVVAPRLTSIVFNGNEQRLLTKKQLFFKKIAFATGAISISSWYIVFILGSLRSIPLSFQTGLTIYIAIVLFAIIMGQVYRKKLAKQNPYEI